MERYRQGFTKMTDYKIGKNVTLYCITSPFLTLSKVNITCQRSQTWRCLRSLNASCLKHKFNLTQWTCKAWNTRNLYRLKKEIKQKIMKSKYSDSSYAKLWHVLSEQGKSLYRHNQSLLYWLIVNEIYRKVIHDWKDN